MKLSAVILARTLAYIDSNDLNSKGKLFIPDLVRALAERYKFEKLPKFEDRQEKGLVFEDGKIGNKVITKLSLFDAIIVLESRSNTSDSKQLIEEMLSWAAAKFDLVYAPGSIKRFAYVSGLSFYSDAPLLSAASQPITDLAAKTGTAVSEIWQEPIQYYPAQITVAHDPLARKNGIAHFMITYRAESRFSENKYYSEAPLPTDTHAKFLEEYERDVLAVAAQAARPRVHKI